MRMLTSCSGDGPPKITAVCVTRRLPFSWVMVRKVVLVEDGVARPEILLPPPAGFVAGVDQDDGDPPRAGGPAEGGRVGRPGHSAVGRDARCIGDGEPGVRDR